MKSPFSLLTLNYLLVNQHYLHRESSIFNRSCLKAIPIDQSMIDASTAIQAESINLKTVATQLTSCFVAYIMCVASVDRQRGKLIIDDPDEALIVKQSGVEGAGLGLFAGRYIEKGTVLGTYPGVVRPKNRFMKKLDNYYRCSYYVWLNEPNEYVIDPTDSEGLLQDICYGGTDDYPLSEFILKNIFSPFHGSTKLARINEPPKTLNCNVMADEDGDKRRVRFIAAREIYMGEEMFIDYGKNYDRTGYVNK